MNSPQNNNAASVAADTASYKGTNESSSAYADGRQVVKNISWLKSQPRFLCWSLIPQPDGTVKKIPYNPTTGRNAESNDPTTWVDYETAKAAVQAGQYHSIGIALGKDLGLCIVDFDKVIAKPGDPWPQWVLDIVEDLNSYTEVSASGRGMHILAWGRVPSNLNRQQQHIEIHDSLKMFAISTEVFEGRNEIEDRAEKLLALHERIENGGDEKSGLIIRNMNCAVLVERCAGEDYDTVKEIIAEYGFGHRHEADLAIANWLIRKYQGDTKAATEEFSAMKLHQDRGKGYDSGTMAKAAKWYAEQKPRIRPDVGFSLTGPRVKGTAFDFVVNPLPGQNDGWFPRGDISLIAASSGGGKSTMVLDLLEKQQRGELVYGHSTNQLPYLIVMEDRGALSLERTLKRMGIDPQKLPYVRLDGGLAAGLQRRILEQPTLPAVVFLEGIDLLNDASDGRNVSADLKLLQQVAEHYHVAIIGSTGSPKQKAKDRYIGLRDQVIGSTAWARKTETIAVLQKENGKETDDMTIMTVLPRNDRPEVFNLVWDHGRFRALTADEIQAGQDKSATDDMLQWVLGREQFTRTEVRKAFARMSGATFTQRLEGLRKAGAIKRHTQGARIYYSVPSAEGTVRTVPGTVVVPTSKVSSFDCPWDMS